MFQTGGLIVFCGLLAQTMAQFGGLPVPLDQTLPLNVNPALPLSPTGLAGSLTNGEYVTTSFRGVCVRVCVCVLDAGWSKVTGRRKLDWGYVCITLNSDGSPGV